MRSNDREVFNHFYNADSVTEDLELVSECRRKDAKPVEGQGSPFTTDRTRDGLVSSV